ncbi:hypothetical protein THASP1DRAFT_31904 [Thamnocephalis sphaerospora]|uniref:Mid2 domain-containing protein n=1 Tax=Thamnocephalis sphaerospora TaxID=78915 RepID=A0A4P9XKJ8_9FUNG|nr:hypothetical protein THASP1DRAFT_31904 [Thamnocephalis sphaerospora]|eukprot:RKP06282.1 hypothetical protein THASP1DRAFT_31904 [Thamnocephalis sphaerospora]
MILDEDSPPSGIGEAVSEEASPTPEPEFTSARSSRDSSSRPTSSAMTTSGARPTSSAGLASTNAVASNVPVPADTLSDGSNGSGGSSSPVIIGISVSAVVLLAALIVAGFVLRMRRRRQRSMVAMEGWSSPLPDSIAGHQNTIAAATDTQADEGDAIAIATMYQQLMQDDDDDTGSVKDLYGHRQ